MSVALAVTYHDPEARLVPQVERVLPLLVKTFSGIAVRASPLATEQGLSRFRAAGASILQAESNTGKVGSGLGLARRQALELALGFETPTLLYSDCDRILHWAENFPTELAHVLLLMAEHDFTIIGRTERAFQSHPRVQRDTEAILNHLFSLVLGQSWDGMAGARGLSCRAAQAILDGCRDEEISVDVSWPLYLQSLGGYTLGYLATEGMEFETQDRYSQEVVDAGGLDAWINLIDSDLDIWQHRLGYIPLYIQAMQPYMAGSEKSFRI